MRRMRTKPKSPYANIGTAMTMHVTVRLPQWCKWTKTHGNRDNGTIDDHGDGIVGVGNGVGMMSMERQVRIRLENEDGAIAMQFHMAKFRMTRRTAKEVYGRYGDTAIVLRRMDYEEIIKQYQ